MTEDMVRSQVKVFEELLDENLKIVKKALGIEAIINVSERPEQENKKSQVQLKIELTNKKARKNVVDNNAREKSLAEDRQYLATKKIEMQAMFAQSRAKFIARQQAKKHSHQ